MEETLLLLILGTNEGYMTLLFRDFAVGHCAFFFALATLGGVVQQRN
jgi:hypothetical protein